MSQIISTNAVLKSQIKMTYPVGFELASLIGAFVDLVNNVLKKTWRSIETYVSIRVHGSQNLENDSCMNHGLLF